MYCVTEYPVGSVVWCCTVCVIWLFTDMRDAVQNLPCAPLGLLSHFWNELRVRKWASSVKNILCLLLNWRPVFWFLGLWVQYPVKVCCLFSLDMLLHILLIRQQNCGVLEYRKKALQKEKNAYWENRVCKNHCGRLCVSCLKFECTKYLLESCPYVWT